MSGAGGADRAGGEDRSGEERSGEDRAAQEGAAQEGAAQERAAETARRRREFIRDHHPDRGGDPESFIAGLRVFDSRPAPGDPVTGPGDEPPARVVVVPHQAWLTRLVLAAVRRLRHGPKPSRVR